MRTEFKGWPWFGLLGVTVACVVWALYAGKDVNSDFLHYHLYAGLSSWGERIRQDLLPAGPQSYLNPYAQALSYALIKADLQPWVIGATLAAIQSLNLWLCWILADQVLPEQAPQAPAAWPIWAAVLLAGLNPLMLAQLGTTYTDITTCLLALAAWCLILRGVTAAVAKPWALVAGIVAGAAVALKLSNVFIALVLPLALLFRDENLQHRLIGMVWVGLGLCAGFLLVHGYWGYRLWEALGNPFFPFLNQWFGGDLLPTQAARHGRFLLESWEDGLTLPFRMALPWANIYVETSLPDARYGLLALLLLSALFLGLMTRGRGLSVPWSAWQRARAASCVMFVVAWLAWCITSANGRYMMPLSFVAGVLIVAMTWPALQRWPRVLVYGVLLFSVAQLTQFTFGARLRWASMPWGQHWIEVQVPESLQQTPRLYIGTDLHATTWLLPYVHPKSAMTQVVGQQAIGLQGPGSKALKSMLAEWQGSLSMVARVNPKENSGPIDDEIVKTLGYRVHRLGLDTISPKHCQWIRLAESVPLEMTIKAPSTTSTSTGPVTESWFGLLDRSHEDRGPIDYIFDAVMPDPYANWSQYLVCDLQLAPAQLTKNEQLAAPVDAVFDRIEAMCPKLFAPNRQLTERGGEAIWSRFYAATDVRINVENGKIAYMDTFRQGGAIDLGEFDEWRDGAEKTINCNHRYNKLDMSRIANMSLSDLMRGDSAGTLFPQSSREK